MYRLAQSMTSDNTAKVWTATIRKGVKFHNGKALTPADVVATIERHTGEDTKSGALGIMRGIEFAKVDGDKIGV